MIRSEENPLGGRYRIVTIDEEGIHRLVGRRSVMEDAVARARQLVEEGRVRYAVIEDAEGEPLGTVDEAGRWRAWGKANPRRLTEEQSDRLIAALGGLAPLRQHVNNAQGAANPAMAALRRARMAEAASDIDDMRRELFGAEETIANIQIEVETKLGLRDPKTGEWLGRPAAANPAAFTPPPWMTDRAERISLVPEDPEFTGTTVSVVEASLGDPLAFVLPRDPPGEAEANLVVIGRAPDMFATLRKLSQAWDYYEDGVIDEGMLIRRHLAPAMQDAAGFVQEVKEQAPAANSEAPARRSEPPGKLLRKAQEFLRRSELTRDRASEAVQRGNLRRAVEDYANALWEAGRGQSYEDAVVILTDDPEVQRLHRDLEVAGDLAMDALVDVLRSMEIPANQNPSVER